jgi:hypothetical protein
MERSRRGKNRQKISQASRISHVHVGVLCWLNADCVASSTEYWYGVRPTESGDMETLIDQAIQLRLFTASQVPTSHSHLPKSLR